MKRVWLIAFVIALIADLIGVYLKNEMLVYISKPLVVITLIFYFLSATKGIKNNLKKFILGALIFSWLGDVLLMFDSMDKNFFLFGLTAFLIAHLFYILYFSKIRIGENAKLNWKFALIVAVYYSGLIYILYNDLGEMKIPVLVYGLVISTMFLLALHMLFIKNREAGKMMMLGALLFVASDSILAINKFYQPFEMAGILIMLTYGLAQLFITLGAARYIHSISKQ
jgi:uncharacterized membrane protein YhhN